MYHNWAWYSQWFYKMGIRFPRSWALGLVSELISTKLDSGNTAKVDLKQCLASGRADFRVSFSCWSERLADSTTRGKKNAQDWKFSWSGMIEEKLLNFQLCIVSVTFSPWLFNPDFQLSTFYTSSSILQTLSTSTKLTAHRPDSVSTACWSHRNLSRLYIAQRQWWWPILDSIPLLR